jgi:hypothetical protein
MKARVPKMFGSLKKTSPNLRVLRSTEKNAALMKTQLRKDPSKHSVRMIKIIKIGDV